MGEPVQPPEGWRIVTDGRQVDRNADLLVRVRGKWLTASIDSAARRASTRGPAPAARNERSIDVIYPMDAPHWQRTGRRVSVDRIAERAAS